MEEMLKNIEWGEFKVGKLFYIQSTLSFNKDKLTKGNKYDYVTRTSQNQGILQETGFVNKENINPAGTWSLGLLQMDFFYRSKSWYAGQFVRKIIPKISLSEKSKIFFTISLNKLKQKLLSVLVRDVDDIFLNSTISLPTKNGKIDFDFMEKFIEEIEKEKIRKLEKYLEENNLKDCTLTSEEKQVLKDFENGKVEWGEFRLGLEDGVFEISTGRDVIIGKVIDGNIPLISHQHENNGITKRIKKLENRRIFNYKDTLPLADRGVFLATTQNENFHIGTRVKALKFKTGEKNLKSRLFFVSSINKLQTLFLEYSKNATNNLPNLKIQLPIKNNDPDFKKMEILISAIEKLVVKKLVEYVKIKR